MVICWPMFFESTCFYLIVSGCFSRKLLLCSIPGSGRSPGGGNGNSLQCSCLGNPMDRVALWATVHGVAKSWTWLRDWVCACAHVRTHTHTHTLSLSLFCIGPWGRWVCTCALKSHSSIRSSPVGLVGMTTIIPQSQIYQDLVSQVLVLKVGLPSVAFTPFAPQGGALGFEFPPDYQSLCQ